MLAAQVLVAVSARSVAAVGTEVSLPQLRVLVILASQGPQSLNALAHNLDVHPSNATRACDKLVDAGLVRRTGNTADRRVLELSLTVTGQGQVDTVMAHRRKQVEDLLAAVPAGEREGLVAALRSLAAAGGEPLERAAWQSGWTTTTPREGR